MIDLPSSPLSLSDSRESAWPLNWFRNFGSSNFYYVAGFKELVESLWGPLNTSAVIRLMDDARTKAPHLVPDRWLSAIAGVSPQDIQIEETRKAWGLDLLTDRNIRKLYEGQPVTFSVALLAVIACLLVSEEHGKGSTVEVQIRFAGSFIVGFSDVYRALSMEQKQSLALATNQISVDYEVFEEVAKGRPVTFAFAKQLTDQLARFSIGAGEKVPRLKIATYQRRTDVGSSKRPASHEIVRI